MLSALLVAAFSAAMFFGAWHSATSLHHGAPPTLTTNDIQGGGPPGAPATATPPPTVTPNEIQGGGPPTHP